MTLGSRRADTPDALCCNEKTSCCNEKTQNYDYLHEGIDYPHEGIGVLAAQAPGLHGALLAAEAAGYSHVNIDGMLVETDRCRTPGPTPGVDLWWSGRHDNHGGNVQVITVPDAWPIWTSGVRPGREHDTTALRSHSEILSALIDAGEDLRALGDLGYEGAIWAMRESRAPSPWRSRNPSADDSPWSNSSSTRLTTASGRSASGATPG